jgi:tRNA/rRNA methyltransferase
MRNFGLGALYLVSPRADHLGQEARAMACSALEILDGAQIVDSLPAAIVHCRWVCGTTARVGERRRAELTARTAARQADQLLPAAFIFGPEDSGLSGEELNLCHAVVSIPTAPELRSLNLAQSVGIVAYELWNAPGAEGRGEEALGCGRPDRPNRVVARAEEIEQALEHLRQTLDAVGYFRQSVPEHPLREFRRFLARARPTRYELAMLRGMCRKTLNTLRRKTDKITDEEDSS